MGALHCPNVNSAAASLPCPGRHVFAVKASHAVAPLSEMRPAAHASQVVAPVLFEKRPVAHVSHPTVPLLDL
jgi:hypothetical protein